MNSNVKTKKNMFKSKRSTYIQRVQRQSRHNRLASNRLKVLNNVIREVAGIAPYERRIIELIKIGKDKRALKLAKKKLGTHLRGKKKRDELSILMRNTEKS